MNMADHNRVEMMEACPVIMTALMGLDWIPLTDVAVRLRVGIPLGPLARSLPCGCSTICNLPNRLARCSRRWIGQCCNLNGRFRRAKNFMGCAR